MSYKPNDPYYTLFTTRRLDTGTITNADANPTAMATLNGIDDTSFGLTVTLLDTGRYRISGQIPASYASGDVVQVWVSATVNSLSDKAVVDSFVVDAKRVGDLNDIAAGTQMDLVSAPNSTAVAALQNGLSVASVTTAIQAKTDNLPADPVSTAHLDAKLDVAVSTRLPATSYTAPDNADIQAIKASTDNLPSQPAAVGSPMTLATSEDIYPADIQFTVDGANSRDEYTVSWFHNGMVVTSGVTAPSIEVLLRSTGEDLIAAGTELTQIGTSGAYMYDENNHRLTPGDAALVTVTATLDGQTRVWRRVVARDSEAGQ